MTLIEQRHHSIPGLPSSDFGPNGDDFTGTIRAGNNGEFDGEGIQALTKSLAGWTKTEEEEGPTHLWNNQITIIQRSPTQMHQDIILTNRRDFGFGEGEIVEAVGALENPLLCRCRSHCCELFFAPKKVEFPDLLDLMRS